MKYKSILAFSLMCMVSSAFATDKLYGVVSAGYSEADFDQSKSSGGTYKLALGYEINRQWYAEFGYQRISDSSMLTAFPTTYTEAQAAELGMQGDALFASVLGKAAGRMGELFYRVGVLKTDFKVQQASVSETCEMGQGMAVGIEPYTICEFDEGGIAGVFGIGFDFFIGVNTMLRTEVEHIRGENGLSTNAGYIGLRYNF